MTRRSLRLKRAAAVLAAALTTTALWGVAIPAPAPARATAPVTLRVWYGTDDPDEAAMANALARDYIAAHRAVRVTLTTYGLDDMNTKMQLALQSGVTSDLIYMTPRGPGLAAYVHAGKLRDLSAAARTEGWAGRLRPGLLAAYNRLLAANARSATARAAGRVYGVPYVMAAVGLLYNKTLLRRLHLAVPRTTGALGADAARVKKAGYIPFGLGNADGWVGDDWWISLVNARATPSALAPALRLDPHFSFKGATYGWAATTLRQWARGGYFTRDFNGLDAQDSVEGFFEGRTAMQVVSSTEDAQILALVRESRLDVGIAPFPAYTARGTGRPIAVQSGYAGWAIPTATAARRVEPALDFIDYALGGTTARLLLAHGLLPAYRYDARTMRPAAPFQRDYLALLDHATPGVYLDSAPVPNINATMEADIQYLLGGQISPVTLLASLQEVYSTYGGQSTSTRTDGEF